MAVCPILQLGNPVLYEPSVPVLRDELPEMARVAADLRDTMMEFRRVHGFGRAIAAPQIGVGKRLFYMHIDEPVVFVNPELTARSDGMLEIWDDCMSFPDLFVRLRRHESCTILYRDLEWREESMELSGDLSELVQHEHDHLDGVLAVMRAIDDRSFALRSELEYLK